MDYADLAVIDMSKMNTPEGLAETVKQARDAMRDIGFFYVINHGISQEKVGRLGLIYLCMCAHADLRLAPTDDRYRGPRFQQGLGLREKAVRRQHEGGDVPRLQVAQVLGKLGTEIAEFMEQLTIALRSISTTVYKTRSSTTTVCVKSHIQRT